MENTLINDNNGYKYKTNIINGSICNHFKSLDITNCSLSQNRIDIWQYPLNKPYTNANSILSVKEQEKAARFHFAKHQRRFQVAHTTLRLILSRYLKNKNPNELKFKENKYGKPELINNNNNLQFNLSHSGDLALLAVGQYFPIGIDLEFFSKRPYENIVINMFSKTEANSFKRLNSRLEILTFFRIWAQKEAFIKACGLGLSYPTQKFDVSHLPSFKQPVIDFEDNKLWHMTSFMPTLGCAGAICHTPQIDNVYYTILENNLEITE